MRRHSVVSALVRLATRRPALGRTPAIEQIEYLVKRVSYHWILGIANLVGNPGDRQGTLFIQTIKGLELIEIRVTFA